MLLDRRMFGGSACKFFLSKTLRKRNAWLPQLSFHPLNYVHQSLGSISRSILQALCILFDKRCTEESRRTMVYLRASDDLCLFAYEAVLRFLFNQRFLLYTYLSLLKKLLPYILLLVLRCSKIGKRAATGFVSLLSYRVNLF